MAAFRPFVNRTQQVRTNRISILNPDSGFEFIEPFLKEDKGWTTFRMFPSFSPDTGEEEEQISENGEMGIGFCPIEVCSVWQNGRVIFISTVQEEDETGRKIAFRYTPAAWMLKRLSYKVHEQNEKRKRNLPTDIPEHWLRWKSSGAISNPQPMFLMQGMAKEINGLARTGMDKRPIWIKPAVFAIPKSAETAFIGRITTPEDDSQPLSSQNNRFGDFCSCAGGRNLRLVRYSKEDKKGGKKIEYALELDSKVNQLNSDEVRDMVKPWEEILYIPTVEESVKMLLETFEPEAVDFGLRNTGYYNYLPERVKGLAVKISEAEDVRALPAAPAAQEQLQEVRTAPVPQPQAPAKPAPRPAFRPSTPVAQTRAPAPVEEEEIQYESPDSGNVQEVTEVPDAELPSATDRRRFSSTLNALSKKIQK